MDERVKKLWTAALRSGEYVQGQSFLRTIGPEGKPRDCCLGVLCDLFAKEHPEEGHWDDEPQEGNAVGFEIEGDFETIMLPEPVRLWAGLDDVNPTLREGRSAADWNDGVDGEVYGQQAPPASFAEIADMIEECL